MRKRLQSKKYKSIIFNIQSRFHGGLSLQLQRFISDEKKDSLLKLLKKTRNKADFQRVQCVWIRAELGFDANTTSKITGWSPGTVKKIWAKYIKNGEESLFGVGRGGRRRHYLSHTEEAMFLEPIFKNAVSGKEVPVMEIKQAYENIIQKIVPKSTIYRMLARHGWKKKT
jgi:hypothetical protein